MCSLKRFYALVLCSFFVIFASTSFLFAEEDEDWYEYRNITKIVFEGLEHVKNAELSGITDSFIGKKVGESISDLIDRLYALDLFDDVTPSAKHDSGNGVVLVFSVTEKPVINSITFRGNQKVRNSPLRDAITIKRGDIFMERKVLLDERAIREVYLDKGYTDVKISYSKAETDSGVDITFVITEGRSTAITDILFVGNSIFSSKVLKKQLKTKQTGVFNKGAFQEAILENDKQSILRYYNDRGYIDASIIDVTRDVSKNDEKNRDDLVITFYIQEGVQYSFDSLSFTGNKVFSTEKLQSLVTLKKGEVFNQTKFQQNLMTITDLYYENGYTSNGFVPVPNKDTFSKTVSFILNITERDRSHVEKIIVKGNTKTKEHVITRELPIETGDVFSKAKITNGLRNLYNLQFFSAVVPDIVSGSEENLVDIVISVEEQMTNSIEFGMTFSGVTDPTQLPFSLFLKWSNSNIAGTGRTLSASTNLSSTEQSVSLGFTENWLFNKPIQLSEALSISHAKSSVLRLKWLPDGTINKDTYYMEYESWTTSLDSSVGRRWMPDFAIVTVSGGLTNALTNYIYNDKLYTPVDRTISDYSNKWGLTNSLWAKVALDGRDVNYDPTQGWFFSQQVAWYGLTPWETDFYLRTDTKLEGYLKLVDIPVSEKWSFKLIFAAYSGFTFQFPAPNSGVGDTHKLYLDGMFDARGWTNIYRSVRGRARWSNRFELRFPVVPGILGLDGFFDAAVIKRTPGELFTGLKAEDWYFSVGPDVRMLLPQFPLRLMLANTFQIKNGDVHWNKTWQFVLSFNLVNK